MQNMRVSTRMEGSPNRWKNLIMRLVNIAGQSTKYRTNLRLPLQPTVRRNPNYVAKAGAYTTCKVEDFLRMDLEDEVVRRMSKVCPAVCMACKSCMTRMLINDGQRKVAERG